MDTVNFLLYLFFIGITSIALLLVLNLLLPSSVERVREQLEGHYLRAFVIGLITLFLSFAILLLLAYFINQPVFNIMASENVPYFMAMQTKTQGIFTVALLLIALALISLSVIGLAAIANSLGRRIGTAASPIHPNLIGAALVILSGLAPYLGWFIFAPMALCIGFGSTIQAIFQRKVAHPAL
jgi:hypothetical protein